MWVLSTSEKLHFAQQYAEQEVSEVTTIFHITRMITVDENYQMNKTDIRVSEQGLIPYSAIDGEYERPIDWGGFLSQN